MGNKLTAIKESINDWNPFRNPWDFDEEEEIKKIREDPYVPPPVLILNRDAWGAKKPKWRQKLKTPVSRYIIRYFSDSDYCWNDKECVSMLGQLQDKHMEMGMPDIAWNFIVGCNGTVYEGRGWETKPTKTDYQTLKYDGQTIDIAVMGDFKTWHPLPVINQALCRLMRKGVELGYGTEGWDLTEICKVPPHAPWTPEYFMKNDIESERIYDDTTEPRPHPGSSVLSAT